MQKKIISMFLGLVVCLSSFILFGCNKNEEETVEDFSIWIYQGELSTYYSDYAENPAINYLMSQTWDGNNDGVGSKLNLTFSAPVTGEAQNNFTTLISTGEYMDMMDMNASSATALDLYEAEIAMDITYYVETYMPNYLAFLNAHPEYARSARNLIDGEWKYISLFAYNDDLQPNFQGMQYRRDWLVKYGEVPTHVWDLDSAFLQSNFGRPKYPSYAEAAANNDWEGWKTTPDYTSYTDGGFTAVYGDDPDNTYTDNVIFPSGLSYPVYISDWEWMMAIMKEALVGEGISDGYVMSLYYPGYLGTGDIVSSFGGGSGAWYIDKNGDSAFSGTSGNFRAYLKCVNSWYEKGWIDTAFSERTGDMFYLINSNAVYQGKVAIWDGVQANTGTRLDMGNYENTDGMMSFGAPLPINDLYGEEENKMQEPDTMFQFTLESIQYIITDKAKDKNLEDFFTFLDYQFSLEGALLHGVGLSKAQFEEIQDPFYIEHGLTEGAYYTTTDENDKITYHYVDALIQDGDLKGAAKLNRFFGLWKFADVDQGMSKITTEATDHWDSFASTGSIASSLLAQMTSEEASQYSKTSTNLNTFMATNVPKFVMGSKDIASDTEWAAFTNAVNKYKPENITIAIQRILDQYED